MAGAHSRYETTGLHPENQDQPTLFDVEPYRSSYSKEEGNARLAVHWQRAQQLADERAANEKARAPAQFHDRRMSHV